METTMQKKYFVMDSEGNVSWSAKTDAAEHFKTKSAAYQRARALAASEPGKPVHVTETVEIVIAKVNAPERLRIHS